VGGIAVLLFDRFPSVEWLFGSLLLAATAVAAVVHFRSERHSLEEAAAGKSDVAKVSDAGAESQVESVLYDIEDIKHDLAAYVIRDRIQTQLAARHRLLELYNVSYRHHFHHRPALVRQELDMDAVIKLARGLSPHRTDYEVSWVPAEGRVVVRPIGMAQASGQKDDIPAAEDLLTRNVGDSAFVN